MGALLQSIIGNLHVILLLASGLKNQRVPQRVRRVQGTSNAGKQAYWASNGSSGVQRKATLKRLVKLSTSSLSKEHEGPHERATLRDLIFDGRAVGATSVVSLLVQDYVSDTPRESTTCLVLESLDSSWWSSPPAWYSEHGHPFNTILHVTLISPGGVYSRSGSWPISSGDRWLDSTHPWPIWSGGGPGALGIDSSLHPITEAFH